MKHHRTIIILTALIVLLSLVAGITGIMPGEGTGPEGQTFVSIHGENVQLHGKGIYANDSVAAAAQAIAQDWVTVFLGVPLLILSCWLASRKSLRARLLFAGTLAYFLYTYMSYSFLCTYNSLFLVYVALMSLCFFAFVLVMLSFDMAQLQEAFSESLPVKTIGTLIITFISAIALMWLGRIVPPLMTGGTPLGLEHYTTLVIQVMDLGLVIPVSILAGILLMRRKPAGLLLAAVMCMKGATMLTSLTAMVINQKLTGVDISVAEMVVFPAANLLVLLGIYVFMTKIKEPGAVAA